MNRQLILCCDGTNNNLTGGRSDTNVTQMCELLAPDEQHQLLFYDPGVGNPGELPGATSSDRISRQFKRWFGLIYGKGIYENIAEGYRFLMRNYRVDDQIFLFGFSRGAFTARSIGGLVTSFGLLRPEMDCMVDTLLYVYFSDRNKNADSFERIKAQINDLLTSDNTRHTPIWFTGVWDTVDSVGAPLLNRIITAQPTIQGKRYFHVRQALALDEYRHAFKPRPYLIENHYDYQAHHQSIVQYWFSGSHADVGGGYLAGESALARETLYWMLQEAVQCDLRLRPGLIDASGQLNVASVNSKLSQRSQLSRLAGGKAHSQLYKYALWSLAGMQVRQPDREALEHSSVQRHALRFPTDTVWQQSRKWQTFILASGFAFAMWLLVGLILHSENINIATLWTGVGAYHEIGQRIVSAHVAWTQWEMGWWLQAIRPSASLGGLKNLAGATMVDCLSSIAAAYLLARLCSWAFSRIAGLQRVGSVRSAWLNRLGMCPRHVLLAGVAQQLLMFSFALTTPIETVPLIEILLALGISLAFYAKWLGLLGCAAMVVWAVFRQHDAAHVQKNHRS